MILLKFYKNGKEILSQKLNSLSEQKEVMRNYRKVDYDYAIVYEGKKMQDIYMSLKYSLNKLEEYANN